MRTPEYREDMVCLGVLVLALAWAVVEAWSFPERARLFPATVASVALVLAAAEMVLLTVRRRARRRGADGAAPGPSGGGRGGTGRAWYRQAAEGRAHLLSILGYYAGIYVLGFFAASALFLGLFLLRVARVGWVRAVSWSLVFLLILAAFGRAMNVAWPPGLVQSWML